MFQTIKNLYRKSVDAVMAIGSNLIQKSKSFAVSVKERAIEGEWLPKSMFASGTAVITFASTSSMAAVPADVTTAITTAVTDVATVGAAVIVVLVGIRVFKWMARAL